MTHDILLIAVMALVTAAIRFLPFVLFSSSRKPPEMVERLTLLLPAAVMGMLIVYCLRNTDLLTGSHGAPEAAACAAVVASYICNARGRFFAEGDGSSPRRTVPICEPSPRHSHPDLPIIGCEALIRPPHRRVDILLHNDHDEGRRRDPRNRVRDADHVEPVHRHEHGADHRPRDHLEDAREHRPTGVAQALHGRPADIQDRQHPEERTVRRQHPPCGIKDHRLLRPDDEERETSPEEYLHKPDDDAVGDAEAHPDDKSVSAPAPLVRPVILGDERGHRAADCIERAHRELLDPDRRRHRRDIYAAQRVVRGLHDHAADRRDRELQTHRVGHERELLHRAEAYTHFIFLKMKNRIPPCHVDKARRAGNRLRDDRGRGRSRAPGAEDPDAEHIKDDIQCRGDCEKCKRRPAVPDRPEDRRGEIVEQHRRDPQENDRDIALRIRVDLRRDVEDPKDHIHEKDRGGRKDKRRRPHEDRRVKDIAAHPPKIARPERAGNRNSEPGAGPHGKPQDQELDRGGRADGRERPRPEELPDDRGVRERVGLLQEISQKQRKCEGDEQA